MRVVFDTNVVLDLLLDRRPFSLDAARCFSKTEAGLIEGWLCATTVTTIHYLLNKYPGRSEAQEAVSHLLSLFRIAPANKWTLDRALNLQFKDSEDAVLHESARFVNADLIVTRNTSDFKNAKLPVRLPVKCHSFSLPASSLPFSPSHIPPGRAR